MSGSDVVQERQKHRKAETCTCCPVCGNPYIQKRKTMDPPWRCRSGHEFHEPDERPTNANRRMNNRIEDAEARNAGGRRE